MKKLIIDPRGGLSGDMFAAGLISICRDKRSVINAMTEAGKTLGECSIEYSRDGEGSARLNIDISSKHHSISEDEAFNIIEDIFKRFDIDEYYSKTGFRILDILVNAEKEAHAKYDFFKKGKIKKLQHVHHHNHESDKAYLHEAQDIVIDITGAVMGLQMLEAEDSAAALYPVSAGGGKIEFSHGLLFVPAPATSIIIKKYNIPWVRGPVDHELFTPTGASIMAGLGTVLDENAVIHDPSGLGISRGSKDYPVPPLKIYLMQSNQA